MSASISIDSVQVCLHVACDLADGRSRSETLIRLQSRPLARSPDASQGSIKQAPSSLLTAIMFAHILGSLAVAGQLALVTAIPYSDYILAPESRTIYPTTIHRVNGTITNAQNLIGNSNGTAIFKGNSSVTFDYQKNIGGIVSITVGPSSSASSGALGVTFTESSLWINGQASDATADAGLDSPLWIPLGDGPGFYTVDDKFDRGAFRYLSVSWNSSEPVEIESVEVQFTAAPAQEDLKAYTGYFHSDDELLNRIWYAGELIVNLVMSGGSGANILTPGQVHTRARCARSIPNKEIRWFGSE